MAVFERPGVFQPETDLSQVVRQAASDTGVIVAAFPRGPINDRNLVTNTRDAITLFGNPDPTFGYGQYAALCALETMNKMYITRVVADDALSSGLLVNVDGAANASDALTSGLTPGGDQDLGIDTLHLVGTGDGSTSTFASTLPSVSDILSLTDIQVGGVTVGPLTVNTVPAVWTIAGPGLSGTSSTLDPTSGAISLVLTSTPANGEEVNAFYTASSTDRAFTVSAENPGIWGNGLKVEITDIDTTTLEFTINVFEVVDGNDVLVESHIVSRRRQLDGFQRQQYLEDVVNGRSRRIRVYDNILQPETVLPSALSATSLTGGEDGSAVSNADLIAGWGLYENKQDIQIDLLINAGYVSSADFSIQSTMRSLAESRDDCFAILDAPFDELSMFPTTDLTNWRLTTQNFNTSYTALYAPWTEVYDSFNDTRNFPIPPSGFVAQVFARRAQNTEAWFPPAGFNDGLVDSGLLSFTKLTHRYTEGQQDVIYRNGVNYLLTEPGTGTAVFGDKTQQTKASALDRINVRRLLNVLKRSMAAFLKFQLFELNTEFLRAQITEVLTDFLRGVQARQGLTDFRVECSEINNTPSVIDNNQLNVDIYIQPTRSINFIKNEFIITRTGVDFNTIINAQLPTN